MPNTNILFEYHNMPFFQVFIPKIDFKVSETSRLIKKQSCTLDQASETLSLGAKSLSLAENPWV